MKLHDYEPVGDREMRAHAIRLEGSEVLTCTVCGCRLTARTSVSDGGTQGPDSAWRHFAGLGGRDARGCRVECMDEPHRLVSSVLAI